LCSVSLAKAYRQEKSMNQTQAMGVYHKRLFIKV
jgi:hypothetical protein